MKKLALFILLSVSMPCLAQTGSEIILFDLKEKKGKILISGPENITRHPGYDNQPSFHPTKDLLYYTSFNEEGRADIKSYNMATGQTKNITQTAEREYSPTVTPDGQFLSCIIQRDNGAQDLGKYPIEGGQASTIINDLIVGYHVWADNSHLALFILGKEGAPNTLHYLRLPTRSDTILAENIGRSLHRVPGEESVSYIVKINKERWEIRKFNIHTFKNERIAETLHGKEDICWTPKGTILSSDGQSLFMLDNGSWKQVSYKGDASFLKGITRLAVNKKGNKLAVVVSE